MLKVYAKFIGNEHARTYKKGGKYHLDFTITDGGKIDVKVSNNTAYGITPYANLLTFLNDWKVLG